MTPTKSCLNPLENNDVIEYSTKASAEPYTGMQSTNTYQYENNISSKIKLKKIILYKF